MTILICGASGRVGRDLCELFDRENIRYQGTYLTCSDRAFCERENMYCVDFTKSSDVIDFVNEYKHQWLVCVFLVNKRNMIRNGENTDDWNTMVRVNVDAVDLMSSLCAKYGIYFIHLSTDYVFDGTTPPYFPTCSQVNPLQNYGISKLISEHRVQTNYTPKILHSSSVLSESLVSPNYCIIRTPVLYSSNTLLNLHDNDITLLSKNVMDIRTNNVKHVDNYYIQRPVYIPDLCIFIRVISILAIEGNASCGTAKFSGIYHFYNPDNQYTKYQITTKIAEYLGLSHEHIIPNECDTSISMSITKQTPYDTDLRDVRYNIRNFFTHTFTETIPYVFERFKHDKIDVTGHTKDSTYFLLFDLDGTLVHTSYAHYRSYLDVFRNRGLQFMTYLEWNNYINYHNIHTYLENVATELAHHDIVLTEQILSDMRNEKLTAFKHYALTYITPTKNAVDMLRFIESQSDRIHAVVVTNSSQETVDIICEVIPELNKITKWCVRETYTKPKPHPEMYAKALEMYYNQEKYIIGFENTSIGYDSLRHVAPIVYLYVDEYDEYAKRDNWYIMKDAFIFDDYRSI